MSQAIDLFGKSRPGHRRRPRHRQGDRRPARRCRRSVVIASRKKENLECRRRRARRPLRQGRPDRVPSRASPIKSKPSSRKPSRGCGPVDILVNNSATNVGQGPSLEVTDDMLDKMIEINIKAALRLVRLMVPRMIERGRGGSILNVSSISGLRPQPMGLLYSFTKAGLIMMTRSWAREFGEHGIRVNALAPGLIQTDFSAYFWEDDGAGKAS